MNFWQRNKTTINDIIGWLESFFQESGLTLSEYKIENSTDRSWSIIFPDQIPIFIIIYESDSDVSIFEIRSELCEIPQDNILPFYRKCLELNSCFQCSTIILDEAKVCFIQRKPIEFLTKEELLNTFAYHLKESKELFKKLLTEFEIIK